MGILADANASLVPKEFADKGWRKVLLLIITVICLSLICAVVLYLLLPLGKYELAGGICGPIVAFIIGIVSWYVGYNIKEHKKVNEFMTNVLPWLQKLENAGAILINNKEEDK